MGALSRTPGGAPVIRATLPQAEELQPSAARLLPAIFPDNPIVLEGLNCLYLNSERAADLTKPQVNAIFAWLNAGGHLIIAVEQPSDISSSPWLKELFPVDVQDLRPLTRHPELAGFVNLLNRRALSAILSPACRPISISKLLRCRWRSGRFAKVRSW